jgi:hypothetical protein
MVVFLGIEVARSKTLAVLDVYRRVYQLLERMRKRQALQIHHHIVLNLDAFKPDVLGVRSTLFGARQAAVFWPVHAQDATRPVVKR